MLSIQLLQRGSAIAVGLALICLCGLWALPPVFELTLTAAGVGGLVVGGALAVASLVALRRSGRA